MHNENQYSGEPCPVCSPGPAQMFAAPLLPDVAAHSGAHHEVHLFTHRGYLALISHLRTTYSFIE